MYCSLLFSNIIWNRPVKGLFFLYVFSLKDVTYQEKMIGGKYTHYSPDIHGILNIIKNKKWSDAR